MWLFIPHYLEQVQRITFRFPLFYFTFSISLSPPGSNSTALPRGCTRVCVFEPADGLSPSIAVPPWSVCMVLDRAECNV